MAIVHSAEGLEDGTKVKIMARAQEGEGWIVRDGAGNMHTLRPAQVRPMIFFKATKEWQRIPEFAVLPVGLDIKVNLDGEKWARLLPA